ncbi:MAG: helix-turn-helix domain-containing protein [Treponemataceae bacterium]|nr:helix-turn-helix domain-containing protein [Treponemataceae bacterium]
MTETEIRALFGWNLKRLRKLRGVSQMQLADSVNMAFTFISDIENGKKWVSPETVAKFTQSLNAEPHHFFLPKDYELKESSDVAAFAQEITDALENAKLRYLIK